MLYAGIKAASVTLGLVSLLADMGKAVQGHMFCDSSATLGMRIRRGLGSTRHIQTSYIWIPDQHETRHWSLIQYQGHIIAEIP